MAKHDGSDCPVNPDAFVVTITRDGQRDCERASDAQWVHDGQWPDDEVLEYEVVR